MGRVVLERVSKRFGSVEAVHDLNLEIQDGEFLCLLGPSGCGKTTTLRMIAGLERQNEGNIYIGDRLVNDLSPIERDIAMVFQFYAIYPGKTVFDNLAFPLQQKHMSKSDIKSRVEEIAEMLEIRHILGKDAMALTAGEKQRVALGRAYVRDPEVFLLDEPLSNLDAELRASMRAELKRIQRDVGQTTIYVTHDQIEGMTMADRIAVMNLGVVKQVGTPANLFDHPLNLFTAGFIGTPSMNFIPCTFNDAGGSSYLGFDGFRVDVSRFGKAIREAMSSSRVVLGIRPTDIGISREKTSERVVPAEMEVLEFLGGQVIVDCRVGKELIHVVGPRELMSGKEKHVFLEFEPSKIHVFDEATENALV